ncbi:hypothetical protein QBC37DRAFT_416776 [Rhypophila decipiens]|uniref:3'(2'),5'-bisphosphate nucleotidase n=1 Tax=Rhypophila decipiens TaxID=261697 RepID=A0AAN7BA49_9PEZI|nr:hypothetical protein QBC37DRAFT_416776 [Rhypophila decipiens]
MDSPYRHELEVAIQAVQAATRISRHVLDESNKGEIQKADLTPVTVADYAIQAVLTQALHSAFPDDGLVGEESAGELLTNSALVQHMWAVIQNVQTSCSSSSDDWDKAREIFPPSAESLADLISLCETTTPAGPDASPNRVWVFDPIDGTKTFLRGEQYAINVALLIGGRQILSVVACPLLDGNTSPDKTVDNSTLDHHGPEEGGCILFAVKGFGAHVRPIFGENVPVRRLPRHADGVTLHELKLVTCWKGLDSGVEGINEEISKALDVKFPGCDLLGWVPRWAVLALGLANMTVWVYKTRERYAKIWDHAGAMLLFEEVGGMITDVDGKDIDLTRGRKFSANFGFVAAPRSCHHLVLRAVRDTLGVQGKGHLLR